MSGVSVDGPSTGVYDVDDLAVVLGCSTRHVRRLADSGAMPRPIHLGRLVRWNKNTIDEWLAVGCPSCRSAKARAT